MFQPIIWKVYEHRYSDLMNTLSSPFRLFWRVCEFYGNLDYPDFTSLPQKISSLSFADASQYMLFYLRFPTRPGAYKTFRTFWENGTAIALVQRLLDTIDSYPDIEKKGRIEPMVCCPKCKTSLKSEYKFCPGCGLDVSVPRCLYCAKEIPDGAKWCPYCGKELDKVHQVSFGDSVYITKIVADSHDFFPEALAKAQAQLAWEKDRVKMSEEKEALRDRIIRRLNCDNAFEYYNENRLGELGFYLGDHEGGQYFYAPQIDEYFRVYYCGDAYHGESHVHSVPRSEALVALSKQIEYEKQKAEKQGTTPDEKWEVLYQKIAVEDK